MWLLIAFIAVPLIEIALFIQVGGWLGLWPTLLIVVVTAIIGSALVRSQGAREMQNLRSSFSDMRDPSEPLANGAMILFSGALLLTPGFFTDFVGFALLVPPVRAAVFQWAKKRANIQTFEMGTGRARHPHDRDRVIDGEFEEIRTTHDAPKGPSGWTKH
ncbi:UPF0716 protein FxsA [Cognatiyoonia koreensis]|uniref:UPF0716 protein FxsA n=1 Tax=Cognatiyoonia koreensis TaxID=364200 RepID=A0A1I0RPP3_9RHOB|nr:FxsA family protein [Cognatiyoonia koreensis]SEW43237.1 UPF0716 protein FxsA [Cognatiyoonia koreensis]